MSGSHCVKTYSQTQEMVALSYGEPEFYGIAEAATMGLCMKGLMEDLGVEVGAQANTDSSAARSIASKKGAWRVRHTDVRELWLYEYVTNGELKVVKDRCEDNVANGLTKEARGETQGGGRHERTQSSQKEWSS